ENFWRIPADFRPIVELALGGPAANASECSIAAAGWIGRMPKAPLYSDEEAHFAAVGASVPPLLQAQQSASTPVVRAPTGRLGADRVYLLTVGTHCTRPEPLAIEGAIATLCALPKGGRVVLHEDLASTYL